MKKGAAYRYYIYVVEQYRTQMYYSARFFCCKWEYVQHWKQYIFITLEIEREREREIYRKYYLAVAAVVPIRNSSLRLCSISVNSIQNVMCYHILNQVVMMDGFSDNIRVVSSNTFLNLFFPLLYYQPFAQKTCITHWYTQRLFGRFQVLLQIQLQHSIEEEQQKNIIFSPHSPNCINNCRTIS